MLGDVGDGSEADIRRRLNDVRFMLAHLTDPAKPTAKLYLWFGDIRCPILKA
jgi:hypothetical protein